jgi:hypothetical protein
MRGVSIIESMIFFSLAAGWSQAYGMLEWGANLYLGVDDFAASASPRLGSYSVNIEDVFQVGFGKTYPLYHRDREIAVVLNNEGPFFRSRQYYEYRGSINHDISLHYMHVAVWAPDTKVNRTYVFNIYGCRPESLSGRYQRQHG